jgi:hypothetical protein
MRGRSSRGDAHGGEKRSVLRPCGAVKLDIYGEWASAEWRNPLGSVYSRSSYRSMITTLSPHCEVEVVVVAGCAGRPDHRTRPGRVSAGRRTAAAFPRFVATHGYDAVTHSNKPLPKIALPEVTSITALSAPATAFPSCACFHPLSQEEFNLYVAPTKTLTQFVSLVAGKMPDPSDPHLILASFDLQDYGVHVGSVAPQESTTTEKRRRRLLPIGAPVSTLKISTTTSISTGAGIASWTA